MIRPVVPLVLVLCAACASSPRSTRSSPGGGVAAGTVGLLPLGDGHLSTSPQVGDVFSCQTSFDARGGRGRGRGFGGPGRGADHGTTITRPWIQGDVWNPADKPVVSGSVSWPNSRITISLEGDTRVVRANNLPSHPTGVFPIAPTDSAYAYDRNPNAIRAQDILLTLPAMPTAAAAPSCVPMGMIGFALSGAAIYNALDADGRDAPAHEIQDHCNGHPQMFGQYHYHSLSACFVDSAGIRGEHSGLVGYALDGYGIYGEHGEHGETLTNADLDACHGHTHAILWDGKRVVMYHYHATAEYPYTIGCFHGVVHR